MATHTARALLPERVLLRDAGPAAPPEPGGRECGAASTVRGPNPDEGGAGVGTGREMGAASEAGGGASTTWDGAGTWPTGGAAPRGGAPETERRRTARESPTRGGRGLVRRSSAAS